MDAHAHAMQRAGEILAKKAPILIPPEIDAQIHAEFEGLVSGELEMPAGWPMRDEQTAPPRSSLRRRSQS